VAQIPNIPDVYTNADIAAYRIFFRRVTTYKQMSDQATSNGQDKRYLTRSLENRLKLGDTDVMNFQIVALDCEKELAPLHAQTKAIINEFLSHFPGNKIPAGTHPLPPPQLAELQRLENVVIWGHRSKLKQVMSADAFQNADIEIRQTYGNPAMNRSLLTPSGVRR
jgi:hypothetical protein